MINHASSQTLLLLWLIILVFHFLEAIYGYKI
jgi:hypothetical protein